MPSGPTGLPEEEAWKAIIVYSATYPGIGKRVSSLEVGKDADVVMWNGNPVTDITATVYRTIVDGNVVSAGRQVK
ncbi:MAG: amidohydrolase family protein [Christensenellales bacterium]